MSHQDLEDVTCDDMNNDLNNNSNSILVFNELLKSVDTKFKNELEDSGNNFEDDVKHCEDEDDVHNLSVNMPTDFSSYDYHDIDDIDENDNKDYMDLELKRLTAAEEILREELEMSTDYSQKLFSCEEKSNGTHDHDFSDDQPKDSLHEHSNHSNDNFSSTKEENIKLQTSLENPDEKGAHINVLDMTSLLKSYFEDSQDTQESLDEISHTGFIVARIILEGIKKVTDTLKLKKHEQIEKKSDISIHTNKIEHDQNGYDSRRESSLAVVKYDYKRTKTIDLVWHVLILQYLIAKCIVNRTIRVIVSEGMKQREKGVGVVGTFVKDVVGWSWQRAIHPIQTITKTWDGICWSLETLKQQKETLSLLSQINIVFPSSQISATNEILNSSDSQTFFEEKSNAKSKRDYVVLTLA